MKQQCAASGFTLIEIMIVVAIIAIIAAIAYPSYTDAVQRARRADALDALLNEAQRFERHFTENNSYIGLTPNSQSPGGFYSITATTTATGFILTATAIGAQARDTACGAITLDQLGARGPAPACWGR